MVFFVILVDFVSLGSKRGPSQSRKPVAPLPVPFPDPYLRSARSNITVSRGALGSAT
jgi:hypothetical protein